MYVGGEIADLARIAQPRIGVVTAVQPVHLSRIGSLEAIEAAKGELLEALPPDGTAILNADDPIVRRMGARSRGAQPELRVRGRRRHRGRGRRLGRSRRDALHAARGRRAPADLDPDPRPAVGPQRAGRGGRRPRRRADARRDRRPAWRLAGRRRTGSSSSVSGGVTVVDDTYNASPRSVVAALDLLAGLPGRRGAVLGEMLELGEASEEGHRVVGEAAARTVDWLVVVGPVPRAIAEGAAAAGLAERDIVRVPDAEAALDALAAAPPRRRRRAGQGVARDRPRPRRRRSPPRARRARGRR